jgi:hypothetical protein
MGENWPTWLRWAMWPLGLLICVYLFCVYLPYEDGLALYSNKFQFPSCKDDMSQVWLKLHGLLIMEKINFQQFLAGLHKVHLAYRIMVIDWCPNAHSSHYINTGDRREKRASSGRPKWPYWCTTAATCVRTGTCRYESTIFQLAVPTPGCATTAAGLHPNSDICGAFLQANFEWQAGETTGN